EPGAVGEEEVVQRPVDRAEEGAPVLLPHLVGERRAECVKPFVHPGVVARERLVLRCEVAHRRTATPSCQPGRNREWSARSSKSSSASARRKAGKANMCSQGCTVKRRSRLPTTGVSKKYSRDSSSKRKTPPGRSIRRTSAIACRQRGMWWKIVNSKTASYRASSASIRSASPTQRRSSSPFCERSARRARARATCASSRSKASIAAG